MLAFLEKKILVWQGIFDELTFIRIFASCMKGNIIQALLDEEDLDIFPKRWILSGGQEILLSSTLPRI